MTLFYFLQYFEYFCRIKRHTMEKEKKERTVIHLQMGEIHEYYGSIANIYEFHTSEELGITYGSLRNYGLSSDKQYNNAKCIIRKGLLLAKSGNRGRKSD